MKAAWQGSNLHHLGHNSKQTLHGYPTIRLDTCPCFLSAPRYDLLEYQATGSHHDRHTQYSTD